jgi:hypothetical protein
MAGSQIATGAPLTCALETENKYVTENFTQPPAKPGTCAAMLFYPKNRIIIWQL